MFSYLDHTICMKFQYSSWCVGDCRAGVCFGGWACVDVWVIVKLVCNESQSKCWQACFVGMKDLGKTSHFSDQYGVCNLNCNYKDKDNAYACILAQKTRNFTDLEFEAWTLNIVCRNARYLWLCFPLHGYMGVWLPPVWRLHVISCNFHLKT